MVERIRSSASNTCVYTTIKKYVDITNACGTMRYMCSGRGRQYQDLKCNINRFLKSEAKRDFERSLHILTKSHYTSTQRSARYMQPTTRLCLSESYMTTVLAVEKNQLY